MALRDSSARQLANTTKTAPQLTAITPRWLVQLLSWVPVESGTYRVNKAKNDQVIDVACGSRENSRGTLCEECLGPRTSQRHPGHDLHHESECNSLQREDQGQRSLE